MSEANGEGNGEIAVKAGPLSFLTKGKRNSELIAALSLAALLVVGYELHSHKEEARESMAIERAERREDRAEMIGVLKDLSARQVETTQAQREANCLLGQKPEQRDPELCKRISR